MERERETTWELVLQVKNNMNVDVITADLMSDCTELAQYSVQ
jgi:hypothetical protein